MGLKVAAYFFSSAALIGTNVIAASPPTTAVTAGYGVIGYLDDYLKLKRALRCTDDELREQLGAEPGLVRDALGAHAVLTDVSSTKASVVAAARAGLGARLGRYVAHRRPQAFAIDDPLRGLTLSVEQVQVLLAEDPGAIVISSFSKYFGMTGWRLGWAVVPEDMVDALRRLIPPVGLASALINTTPIMAMLIAE